MDWTAEQTRRAALIAVEGQPLTVTRRAGSTGGPATTQTVYFLVQPIGKDVPTDILLEGDINAANPNPYRFICGGTEDVKEAVDSVAYDGGTYQLTNVNPKVRSGVAIDIHCIGIRTAGF